MGYSRRGRNFDGCLYHWRERQLGKNHKQRHWSFLLKAISAAVRGLFLPAQPACAGESSHACPLLPSQSIWGRLPSETGWRGARLNGEKSLEPYRCLFLDFKTWRGGGVLVMPNPCRAHSPLGLAPAFLCLPIIPLPTGPNAGLSKGEALATPLWLSSADFFITKCLTKTDAFQYDLFWRLFWLLKTSFKSYLCYEVVLSSFDLPARFCSTVCWPTETTNCVSVFSVTMWTVVQGNQSQVAGPLQSDGLFCKTALTD